MPRKSKGTGTPKKFRQRKLDVYMSSSPPASNDELSPARPSKRTKRRRTRNESKDTETMPGTSSVPANDDDDSQSSDAGAIHFEREVVEVSSGEDEEDRAPRPSQASRRKRVKRAHSDDSVSPQPASGEEEPEIYVRKGKRPAKVTSTVLDSDEEEEPSVKKRKLVKGERPPTPEEDAVDLLDEVDEGRTWSSTSSSI